MSTREDIQGDIRVTLLGTGGPPPVMHRFGPSTLVEAGTETLLFDAGRGAIQRLAQLDPPVRQVRSLFLTHLHSDHTIGLPDLWLTGWLNGRAVTPFNVWGPRGTVQMMHYLDLAFQYDIRIRSYDDRLDPLGAECIVKDIDEGVVHESNGVKVSAFYVDHAPISPAFGYRVDYAGRSAVICGDTRYCENLISWARGTDLLVHEVIVPDLLRPASGVVSESAERVIEHHTVPEKTGEVFTQVQPKLAVYSHIIPVQATAEDILPLVRTTYDGPLEVGEDLMVIDIGDDVTVHHP